MDIYLTIEDLKCAVEIGKDAAKIIRILGNYIECLQKVESIGRINRKLTFVRDILNQDEENNDLKYTRALGHLEAVYVDLVSMLSSKLIGSRKIRHKKDQVSIEMAIIHKLLGDPVDMIYKYAVEKTSLSKPVADHLCWSDEENYNKKYFLISREQLKWLITEEKYSEFIKGYNGCIYEMSQSTGSAYDLDDGCFCGYHYGD